MQHFLKLLFRHAPLRALSVLLILSVPIADSLPPSNNPGLEVTYDAQGIHTISYNRLVLEDVTRYPADAMHIWHMKTTDLKGGVITSGPNGWGETNSGKHWDASAHTWTYTFPWGSISIHMESTANSLEVEVTEVNQSNSGIIFDGASIYPFALHLAGVPESTKSSSLVSLNDNVSGPSVQVTPFQQGVVAIIDTDPKTPLYSGLLISRDAKQYNLLISSTSPDSLPTFQQRYDRPIAPGHSDHFRVSIRFAASGIDPTTYAADVYRNWNIAWPATLHWPDRRMIGTVYMATSPPSSGVNGRLPNNRRRYFNGDESLDMSTAEGLQQFQALVLEKATAVVGNLKRLGAQGVITWDIEGEQFPQPTSYVCSPDQIARLAPEMESVIHLAGSQFYGMKLDDAYFKTIHDAGFRIGVCVRPQRLEFEAGAGAHQSILSSSEASKELIRKMRYAHDRWGATLFYADSTVTSSGGPLEADLIRTVAESLPDSLLIPEESSSKAYRYSAGFKNFIFHGSIGSEALIRAQDKSAFSAILINDVSAAKLESARSELTASVRGGDILLVHADYWDPNNVTASAIYKAAHSR